MSVFLLILGLVLFVGLIVVHEFGHFIVARRNGIEVEEFGIGFPPRIWSRKTKSGFLFSINILPLGGFVKLKGEHDADTNKGSFGAATTWAKTKVMLAGVSMNLLGAFVLLMILAWVGMPQLVNNQYKVASDSHVSENEVLIGLVESGSPAQKAGLKVRDRIEEIGTVHNLQEVKSADQLPSITSKFAGQRVNIVYVRNGQQQTASVQLRTTTQINAEIKSTGSSQGYLGIAPTEYTLTHATWSAPIVAAGLIKQFTMLTLQGLGTAVSALSHGNAAKASAQVSGPVGIFVLLRDGSLLGYQFVLLIVAIISLTLALMNVLPIPALDGGRLFVMLVSRLLRKPLNKTLEERITGIGFIFLMLLIVLITISDVKRYF
jgi:regulator of sigma E protease